jgi:anti-sigma regulatory factor (Ser/Thr protein kinase)
MFDTGSEGDRAPTRPKRPGPVNRETVPAAAAAPPIATAPSIATGCRSSVSFPATASQIVRARQFLEGFLADSPLAADATLCLSEIATNSVIHSNSRREGGRFTVNVERYQDGHVRVEVKDQGGPWIERKKPEGQLSLGLRIVGQLAGEWGIRGDSYRARTVWFEVGPIRPSASVAA